MDTRALPIEQQIVEQVKPFEERIQRLCTIPGVNIITAWTIVAEIGVDMSPFPDADHLASWAELYPGLNESGGKRRSGRMRQGKRYLRRALCQMAWAISHTQG